jgi:hypothetical protein
VLDPRRERGQHHEDDRPRDEDRPRVIGREAAEPADRAGRDVREGRHA